MMKKNEKSLTLEIPSNLYVSMMVVAPIMIATILIGCVRSCEWYPADNYVEEYVESKIEDTLEKALDIDVDIDLTP